jgi:hypothetical protein
MTRFFFLNACKFCPNECPKKYARVQTAVKWLQRACWCSKNSCRGEQAARRAGSLAELQTAAERQLDFASGSISWATSKIANSCRSRDSWVLQAALSAGSLAELQTAADREAAGFCKRLSQLGH